MTTPRGRLLSLLAAFVGALLLLPLPARAAPEPLPQDFWNFPPGAVAFCAVDPRLFGQGPEADPARALIDAGLRGLIDNILPADAPGPLDLSAFLTPAVLGDAPYRLCLLKIGCDPDRAGALTSISAVIEIRAAKADHPHLSGALQAALDRPGGPSRPPAIQSAFSLKSGQKATRFSREGGAPWRTVEWTSSSTAFLVGIGEDSLDSFFAPVPSSRDRARPEWVLHRNQLIRDRGYANPILEAYIDLNALRLAAPEDFSTGRMARLAAAWRIANARGLMVHARMPRPPREGAPPPEGPPLMGIDISFSSRAEPPGAIRTFQVGQAAWPADAARLPRPDAAAYSILLRADWPTWIIVALDTFSALAPESPPARAAQPERWLRRHGSLLERAGGHAGPWVLISGGPSPSPRPIAAAATLIPSRERARIDADLRILFNAVGAEVRRDNRSGVWTLSVDAAEPALRSFSWSIFPDGSLLQGAWNPEALQR